MFEVDQLLTIPEVSKKLRLSRASVYVLLSSGTLPSVKLGRSRRIIARDLADFINSPAIHSG
jgi:excisionase family DNA binding protein